ncbi:unnamed protein product [Allacma fusca]|uniref:Cytochrome P450 n=1 Tax=Allacma fusca TaxID=39272 RepID=A0A8J2JX31_9HEXA|nr:unnamed protein product [Allacma fusca]
MLELYHFVSGFILIVTYIVTYFLYQFWFTRKFKFARSLPGPTKYPFFGSAISFYGLPNHEATTMVHFKYPITYGTRYTLSFGSRVYFTSTRPNDIEKLLSSTTHLNKGAEYNLIMPWLGEGLLTSQGSKWFHRRKMLTPSFHFKILEEFMSVYNEQSKVMVDILKRDSDGGKKAVEISQYITLCTLDIICETAMGKSINAQREKDSPYVNAIYEFNKVLVDRSLNPLYDFEFLWKLSSGGRQEKKHLKVLHGFTNSVIKERKQELLLARKTEMSQKEGGETSENSEVFMSKKKRAVAFMDLLLNVQAEDPNSLSDTDIREETDTFMFEGHDTTATSLSWIIFLIGCYPNIQEKIHKELQDIFGDDKDRMVTTQDLTQLKYLECVIKESLRLYPSVPFISRQLREDLVLDDGVIIPNGVNFSIFPLQVHRNPEVWSNPEEFNPERFFPENANGRHPYAYIPFSAGPRNCIGQKFALMEEKVVLAQVFRNFRLESVEKREDVLLTTEIILRSKDGLHVKAFPR